jgi:hypothetical protein
MLESRFLDGDSPLFPMHPRGNLEHMGKIIAGYNALLRHERDAYYAGRLRAWMNEYRYEARRVNYPNHYGWEIPKGACRIAEADDE